MDVDELKYWWETTPSELLAKHRFIRIGSATEALEQETEPFTSPQVPLPGFAGLTYQLALSDRSINREVQLQRGAHPQIHVSGDQRSGILAFDGDDIVASFVLLGNHPQSPRFKLVVNPEHQGTGLAQKLFELWGIKVKRLMKAKPKQPITVHATVALLQAHEAVVLEAQSLGLPVPPSVLQAVQAGTEAAALIDAAWAVQERLIHLWCSAG